MPHNSANEPIARGSILACALEAAEAVTIPRLDAEKNLTWKFSLLAEIARLYARAGKFEEALAIVAEKTKEDPARTKPPALGEIAIGYLKAGNIDGMRKVVDMIDGMGEWTSSPALAKVAGACLEAGKIGQAVEIAGRIGSGGVKTPILLDIARHYIHAGETANALQILSKAHEAAKTIDADSYDVWAPGGSGDMRFWISDYAPRLSMLVEVARAYAEAGDEDKGKQIAGLMEQAAEGHYWKGGMHQWKAKALMALVEVRLKAGNKDGVQPLLSQALGAAESILSEKVGDSQVKATLFVDIADAYKRLGQEENTKDALSHALEAAAEIESIGEPKVRLSIGCEVLALVAGAYAESGHKDKAIEIAGRALKIAQSVTVSGSYGDDKDKVEALARIAGVYAVADEKQEASKLFSEAAELAGKVKDPCWRAQAYLDIVEIYLKLGQRQEAEDASRTLQAAMKNNASSSSDTCWVQGPEGYLKVINACWDEGKFDDATRLIEDMEPCWGKVGALVRFANQYEKEGQKDKAEKLMVKALEVVEAKDPEWDRELLLIANEYSTAEKNAGGPMKTILEKIAAGIK